MRARDVIPRCRCGARTEITTQGGRLIETEHPCVCPPKEPAADLRLLPNDCIDCGKPCAREADRCPPCGNAHRRKLDRKRAARRKHGMIITIGAGKPGRGLG